MHWYVRCWPKLFEKISIPNFHSLARSIPNVSVNRMKSFTICKLIFKTFIVDNNWMLQKIIPGDGVVSNSLYFEISPPSLHQYAKIYNDLRLFKLLLIVIKYYFRTFFIWLWKCNICLTKIWVMEKVNFLQYVHFRTCEYIDSQFGKHSYTIIKSIPILK